MSCGGEKESHGPGSTSRSLEQAVRLSRLTRLREGDDKLVMLLECERCLVAAAERRRRDNRQKRGDERREKKRLKEGMKRDEYQGERKPSLCLTNIFPAVLLPLLLCQGRIEKLFSLDLLISFFLLVFSSLAVLFSPLSTNSP